MSALFINPASASAGQRFTSGSRVFREVLGHSTLPYFRQGFAVANLATSFPEPSGMARPNVPANAAYLWMEQDSGGPNTFLAVHATTGAASGSWTLQGVTQNDAEDCASCAVNGTNYLYFADIGNNANATNSRGVGVDFILYRMPEPTITGSDGTIASGTIEAIQCAFPGGNTPAQRDAECLVVDALNGDMYVITKRIFPALIYKLAHAPSYAGLQTLTYVGKLACDSSATSLTVATTGSIAVTTALGLDFPVGMKLRFASRANAANWFEACVTARAGTALTVYREVNTPVLTETPAGGSGTFTDWDITLPMGWTASGNNGCITGGDCAPSGAEIALCTYSSALLFPRGPGETIGTALARAPSILSALPGGQFASHNNTMPMFPQRESIVFGGDGQALYSISEFVTAIGTINPLIRNNRTMRPVTTLRLQNGLNAYAGCADTFIDSAVPGTSQATATSVVADIQWGTATNITAAATASGGTQTTFTVASGTGFVVGCAARISVSSVPSYLGTWEVAAVAGTAITLKVPFNGTATGTAGMTAHTQDRQVLLKFSDLSPLPAGATVVDAVLRLFVNTEGEGLSLHRMKVPWADTDTWTLTGGIIPQTNVKANSIADAAVTRGMATYVGYIDLPVPVATIQGWKDGPLSNYGWVIVNHQDDLTGNGFQFDSCESTTPARKPMLVISYM